MMIINWLGYFAPIGVGLVAGLIYSGLFLLQQSTWVGDMRSRVGMMSRLLFFIMRIAILLYIARYLLRSELIPSILGAMVFIIVFWLVILSVKVFLHEWIRSIRN